MVMRSSKEFMVLLSGKIHFWQAREVVSKTARLAVATVHRRCGGGVSNKAVSMSTKRPAPGIGHALLERFGNPRVILLHDILRHLRPFAGGQIFKLLDDFGRTHD